MVTTADAQVAPPTSPAAPPVSEVAPEVVLPGTETMEPAIPVVPTTVGIAPVAEPTPIVPPPIDTRVQQELDTLRQQISQDRAQLEQRESQLLDQENMRGFQAALAQLQKELEETDGLIPERAQIRAQQIIGAAYRAYQAEQNAQLQVTAANAKVRVATYLAQQYKVPVTTLLEHNTPRAMEKAAQDMTAQNTQAAKIAQLEAQIAKLTKGGVPAQTFSSGVIEGGGTTATPDNIDALYMKDPKRYEAVYRKFLRG